MNVPAKIKQLLLIAITVTPILLFSQDTTSIQPKNKKKFSIAAESGITIGYPDRVHSNGVIQGCVNSDPYIGILTSFNYRNVAFETGLLRHTYYCGVRINDPLGESSSSVSLEESAYFRIPLRISTEIPLFYKNIKGISFEPFAGVSKLITSHSNPYGYTGFGGSAKSITNEGDTISYSTEGICIRPAKSVWTGNIGTKVKYKHKNISFCLIGEYFSSNRDWNITKVTYNRNSKLYGALTESGEVYSKAKSLSIGAFISFAF
ncbi:MAG: hypothetical protein V4547_11690 [Bacteroidota bacterium]